MYKLPPIFSFIAVLNFEYIACLLLKHNIAAIMRLRQTVIK